MRNLILLGLAVVGSQSLVAATATSTVEAAAVSSTSVFGTVDVRPTYFAKKGQFKTENSAEAGVGFGSDIKVSAAVFVDTNLYNDKLADEDAGVNPEMAGGFVRARFNNLWKSADGSWSFGYQPRAYLPLAASDSDTGMVAIVRNYFNFTKKFNDTYSLTLSEIPIVHVFSKEGNDGTANGSFENRIYAILNVTLTDKLSFSLPLFFHQKKHRSYQAGAKNAGAWTYTVWTWPEITYQLTDAASVGFGFYSGNLIASDFSDLNIGGGLSENAYQLSFAVSI